MVRCVGMGPKANGWTTGSPQPDTAPRRLTQQPQVLAGGPSATRGAARARTGARAPSRSTGSLEERTVGAPLLPSERHRTRALRVLQRDDDVGAVAVDRIQVHGAAKVLGVLPAHGKTEACARHAPQQVRLASHAETQDQRTHRRRADARWRASEGHPDAVGRGLLSLSRQSKHKHHAPKPAIGERDCAPSPPSPVPPPLPSAPSPPPVPLASCSWLKVSRSSGTVVNPYSKTF